MTLNIQTASIEQLESEKNLLEFSIGDKQWLTRQRFEELKILKTKIDKRLNEIPQERRILRNDPKYRASLFSSVWNGISWTKECEIQCALLDKEEKTLQNSLDLGQFERDLISHENKKQKLELVKSRLAALQGAKEREKNRLAKSQIAKDLEKQKNEVLKIRAKRNEDEIRSLSVSVKRRLQTYEACPYCGGKIGADRHADHIFPVSKGGLSIESNMVIVCANCNMKKSNLTLAMFIKKYQLERDKIEARLTELKKDF
jgi:5-methylcytosine-specific restriction endonuclease McrA